MARPKNINIPKKKRQLKQAWIVIFNNIMGQIEKIEKGELEVSGAMLREFRAFLKDAEHVLSNIHTEQETSRLKFRETVGLDGVEGEENEEDYTEIPEGDFDLLTEDDLGDFPFQDDDQHGDF